MIQSLYDEVSLSHINTRLVVKRFPVHKLLMCFQFSVSTRTKSHSLFSKDIAVYQDSSNTFRLTFMPRKLSCTQQVNYRRIRHESQVCVALFHLRSSQRSREITSFLLWLSLVPKISSNSSKLVLVPPNKREISSRRRHSSSFRFCFNSSILALIGSSYEFSLFIKCRKASSCARCRFNLLDLQELVSKRSLKFDIISGSFFPASTI